MRIQRRIKLYGDWWTVKRFSFAAHNQPINDIVHGGLIELSSVEGLTDYELHEIWINSDLCYDEQVAVLFHEIKHVEERKTFHNEDGPTDCQTDWGSAFWLQFIRDNLKWMTAEYNENH